MFRLPRLTKEVENAFTACRDSACKVPNAPRVLLSAHRGLTAPLPDRPLLETEGTAASRSGDVKSCFSPM
jgi:hypothetical protein